MTSLRAAVYARNSKPPKGWKPSRPGEEPPGSWTKQTEKCREAALREGDEIVLEVHDTATGGDPNRPGWRQVMAGVRGGTIRRVYVTKLDRVMRSLRHFLEVAEEFEARGAELVFLDQPSASVRKGDAAAKALRGMLGVFAEFELDLTRERSGAVFEIKEDGKMYGPRSEVPAGRPVEYGPEHKFRVRDGRREHDRARCRACRVGKPGVENAEGENPVSEGVGYPVGFPTGEPAVSGQNIRPAPMAPSEASENTGRRQMAVSLPRQGSRCIIANGYCETHEAPSLKGSGACEVVMPVA